jgi:4-hydroxy-tetrahydrodipicolinate synthase
METTLRLTREVENIVATKEASSNLSQIMEILRERPEVFRVFSGDDSLTFPLVQTSDYQSSFGFAP